MTQQYDAFVPADREAYIVTIAITTRGDTRPTAADIHVIRQSVVAWRIRAPDGRAEPVTCEGSTPRTLMWLRPGLDPFELYEPRSGRTYASERDAKIAALCRAFAEWAHDHPPAQQRRAQAA